MAYLALGTEDAAARAPAAAELRSFLAATLPDYMLPAAYVALPALPLTAHGKVDRRALADLAPAGGSTRAAAGYAAPRDALERHLAGLFQAALKVERVGIHDGFFELGGNSIAGAVLVNHLQRELGEIVQVVVIFDAPTVAQLADHLRREHPRAVARRWGDAEAAEAAPAIDAPALARVDEAKAAELRRLVPPLPPLSPRAGRRAAQPARPLRPGAAALGDDPAARHARRPSAALRSARARAPLVQHPRRAPGGVRRATAAATASGSRGRSAP